MRCNEKVKFQKLMDWTMDLGADYLATGHYAGIRFNDEIDQYELVRSADSAKDQSYFLFVLRQELLSKIVFPIGELTKHQVRELARRLELPVADKPDSQGDLFCPGRGLQGISREACAEIPPQGRANS